jgi:hypothetical protein
MNTFAIAAGIINALMGLITLGVGIFLTIANGATIRDVEKIEAHTWWNIGPIVLGAITFLFSISWVLETRKLIFNVVLSFLVVVQGALTIGFWANRILYIAPYVLVYWVAKNGIDVDSILKTENSINITGGLLIGAFAVMYFLSCYGWSI